MKVEGGYGVGVEEEWGRWWQEGKADARNVEGVKLAKGRAHSFPPAFHQYQTIIYSGSRSVSFSASFQDVIKLMQGYIASVSHQKRVYIVVSRCLVLLLVELGRVFRLRNVVFSTEQVHHDAI